MGEKIVEKLDIRKDQIGYGLSRIVRRIGYMLAGIPIGWSFCHHYVNTYGGVYPNISSVRYFIDLFGNLQIIDSINSLGGISAVVGAVIAIMTAYFKIKKG